MPCQPFLFIYMLVHCLFCYHFPFSNMCSNFIYCLVLLPFPFFNMYSYNIYCLILLPYSYVHVQMISFTALFCNYFHLSTHFNDFIHCIVLPSFSFSYMFKLFHLLHCFATISIFLTYSNIHFQTCLKYSFIVLFCRHYYFNTFSNISFIALNMYNSYIYCLKEGNKWNYWACWKWKWLQDYNWSNYNS